MADLISVIVPAYNVATDLPRCLDSILAQTYPHIEIVAVDDGSLDGSDAVLDSYAKKHPSIRVIHKENGGVTSARMCGVQEASGTWIGFVDGDDEIEPDMYDRLLKNAIQSNADISHCGYQMHFSDGRIHYFHNTGLLEQQDKITALRELLSGSMIEPGLCNKLFHKTLFHGISMPLDIKINEDLLMNYYLFSAAEKTVFEDWCPYHYIVRNTSVSRAKLNPHKIYDPIRVKDLIQQSASLEIWGDAKRAYINTCINTYHILISEGTEYHTDLKKIYDLIKKETSFFHLLGKKRQLMANFIIIMPSAYKLIYNTYCRFFQKKVYS